jgi:hypothetical protein
MRGGRHQSVRSLGSLQVQWLKSALSKWPSRIGVSLSSPEVGCGPSFRNVVFSSYLGSRTVTKSANPVILIAIHHRQNPSDSTNTVWIPNTWFNECKSSLVTAVCITAILSLCGFGCRSSTIFGKRQEKGSNSVSYHFIDPRSATCSTICIVTGGKKFVWPNRLVKRWSRRIALGKCVVRISAYTPHTFL